MQDPQMADMIQLEYVLKGMKRTAGGHPSRTRLLITPTILRRLGVVWTAHQRPFDAAMLWAAACMCFFGFLRSGEVVVPSDATFDPTWHLAYGDVKVDNVKAPRVLEVRIKASKTDPFRKGVSIYLGTTGCDLCPVAAILGYMVCRGPSPGAFFQFKDGKLLTRERLVTKLREALGQSGMNADAYAGHSFRVGAATTAAQQGIPDSLIKTLGRWKSIAYQEYIRTPRATLCSVSRTLVRDTGTSQSRQ